MDCREIIEDLCSNGHRGSTTKNERLAANYIANRFREIGLEPELQEFQGQRCFPKKLIPSIIFGLVGGTTGLFFKLFSNHSIDILLLLISIIFSVFGAIIFFLESSLKYEMFSRFYAKGESLNVLAKIEKPSSKNRIILVAHMDSQKGGFLFSPNFLKFLTKFTKPDSTFSPIHIMFLSIIGIGFTSTLLYLLESSGIFHLIIFGLHLFLIFYLAISLALMVEWSKADFVAGANDNASGVAVLLSIAEDVNRNEKDDKYANTDIWFLSTGCEETGVGGSFAFLDKYSESLKNKTTSFIILDGFGKGVIHYLLKDGLLKKVNYDPNIIKYCQELTTEGFSEALSIKSNAFTDGVAFVSLGFPTISLVCVDFNFLISNYHWFTDIPENIDYNDLDRGKHFVEALMQKISEKV